MDKNEYSPIVISGPSGSGKSAFIEYIEKQNPLFIEATGATTRARREGEDINGRMHFLAREQFEDLIKSERLIEYCVYNGNYYGVSKDEFKKLKDNQVIFNVGYTSAEVIKKIYEDTYMIYLLPPNKEELIARLGNRGMERYEIGVKETMQYALMYEYLLISHTNDFKTTYEDFMDITNQTSKAKQKKLILAKNQDFIKNFYK